MSKLVPPPIPQRTLRSDASEARVSPPPIPQRAAPAKATSTERDASLRETDALVEAARAGDARAFEGLVKRYRHRIFALGLHMTGSASDADDITQEAFVRAFQNMSRFEGRSEFFTWLYRIALNRALNLRRDQGRRRISDIDDPRVVVAIAVDAGGDPGRALELREVYACLVQAFDRLSPLLRTTVALTMLQGLSYPEAAIVLETTEGTVAWRIHEARKQMHAGIEAHFAGRAPAPAPSRARKDPTPLPAQRAAARVEAEAKGTPSLEMAIALLAPSV